MKASKPYHQQGRTKSGPCFFDSLATIHAISLPRIGIVNGLNRKRGHDVAYTAEAAAFPEMLLENPGSEDYTAGYLPFTAVISDLARAIEGFAMMIAGSAMTAESFAMIAARSAMTIAGFAAMAAESTTVSASFATMTERSSIMSARLKMAAARSPDLTEKADFQRF